MHSFNFVNSQASDQFLFKFLPQGYFLSKQFQQVHWLKELNSFILYQLQFTVQLYTPQKNLHFSSPYQLQWLQGLITSPKLTKLKILILFFSHHFVTYIAIFYHRLFSSYSISPQLSPTTLSQKCHKTCQQSTLRSNINFFSNSQNFQELQCSFIKQLDKFQIMSEASDFSPKAFQQAISVTKKIKTNLKPFLEKYSQLNMVWIYQSFCILYATLNDPKTEPAKKMNSLYAIKCIAESCDIVNVNFVEIFFLPIIRLGAFSDAKSQSSTRGGNFFQNIPVNSKEEKEAMSKIGHTYVLICTQIILYMSEIKPFTLYYNTETSDLSDFAIAGEDLKRQLAHPHQSINIFKESPKHFRQIFVNKLKQFEQKSEIYSQFVDKKFYQQLKTGFSNSLLDIRAILKSGDYFITSSNLGLLNQMIVKSKQCNSVRIALQLIYELVKKGNQNIRYFSFQSDGIKYLVKGVLDISEKSLKLDRGETYLPQKKGSAQQKRNLYSYFLRCLQFWAHSFLNETLEDPPQQSQVQKYYALLKNKYKFEFPRNITLEAELKEVERNLQRNNNRNQLFFQQFIDELGKQNDNSIILKASDLVKASNTQPKISSQQNIKKEQIKRQENKQSKVKIPSQSAIPPSQKKQEVRQSENNNSKASISNSKIPSEKVIVTPAPPNKREEIKERFKQVYIQYENLCDNQKVLAQNVKKFDSQTKILEQLISTTELQDQDLQIFMNKYVEIDSKREKILSGFAQYQSSKISFEKFRSIVNPNKYGQYTDRSSKQKEQNSIKKSTIKNIETSHNQSRDNIKQMINAIEPSVNETVNKSNQSIPQLELNSKLKQEISKTKTFPTSYNEQKQREEIVTYPKNSRKEINESSIIMEERVEFERSSMIESRITNERASPSKNYLQHSSENIAYENNDHHRSIKQLPAFENINYKKEEELSPIKRSNLQIEGSNIEEKKQQGQSKSYYQESNKDQYEQNKLDDEFIQSPILDPLNNSYHSLNEIIQEGKKSKTFKDVIKIEDLMIKNKKKQALFELSSEAGSLIKPSSNIDMKKNSHSRWSMNINVPQLLQEKNKKFEMEMKIMEQNKNKKIKQLERKLTLVEGEKTIISESLRKREQQIKVLKSNTDSDGAKSQVSPYNMILDQQNYVMKKLNSANATQTKKVPNPELKNQSRLLAGGKLINTRPYNKYFQEFKDEKQKKIQMKNKELLYKSTDIQIGYMGHLEGHSYRVTLFITPQNDFQLVDFHIEKDGNLLIKHGDVSKLSIKEKKQEKIVLVIEVEDVPFVIPTVILTYRFSKAQNEKQNRIKFVIPCAFHKFFCVKSVAEKDLNNQFQYQNVIRGEEIPYSRKILKSMDMLRDFLPHLEKLNKGQLNNLGQICYGGRACWKNIEFSIKISVKPNQFLYIQVVDSLKFENQTAVQTFHKVVDFYVATLNHFLMKNIDWN